MNFRHSLRTRIIISFALFGAVLGILYAAIIYLSLDQIDDHLIDTHLKEEMAYFAKKYRDQGEFPQPIAPQIRAYVGTETMPPNVLKMVEQMETGVHETHLLEEEYHILIQMVPELKKPLYLVYAVSDLELTERRQATILMVLVAGVVLMILLGLLIGWLIASRMVAPVVYLSRLVGNSNPENLPENFSGRFVNDEVGVLAKVLEQTMQLVNQFIGREQQLSRYISHELRTPVTIVKGAVTLMKGNLSEKDKALQKPLKRIERSVNNMENIMEALLWLSKENRDIHQAPKRAVVSMTREIIEQSRYLIGSKPIDIELMQVGDPQISIPTPLFQIAFGNLIRNAIENTLSGIIRVQVKNERVVVSDNGRGLESEELACIVESVGCPDWRHASGLGLLLVKQICDRLKWRLKIESEVGRGTVAQLIFHPISPSAPSTVA